jgi:conjugal transfer pilus assembly protein TraF
MQINHLSMTYLFLFMLSLSHVAFGNDDELFKDQGWNWYKEEALSQPKNPQTTNKQQDPIERRNASRLNLERALIEAYENPTIENTKKYYDLQREQMVRAYRFQKAWNEMLLQYPEEDFSLVHPADSLARKVEVDELNHREDEAIAFFAKSSGLFFFYKSTCPYCHAFAPILKRFAHSHGISVIPITLDGVSLKEFPESYKDRGQAALFNVKVQPALFIVNPYTKKAIPFGFGLMSESDLKRRFLEIAQKIKGELS